MDPNGRGDHHQVQAAAGRAVGGGPPSSATASASVAASFLPPPAPLAVDAAFQPRAADSEDPTPPPASSAAATAFGIENPPSDGEMEQIERGSIRESMEHIEREDGAPVPPVQTDAEYEEMVNTIRSSVAETQSEDVPLPPSQIAVLADANRGEDETDAKKKPALTTERDDASLQRTRERVRRQQEEIVQQVQEPHTPPTPPAASPPRVQDGAIPTTSPRQQTTLVRPPPRSMLPSPDEDTVTPSVPVPAPPTELPTELSAPVLEGTLAPDLPVYDAVQVSEQTRFEKNKKIIIGVGMGLLIGAVTAGVSVNSNNGGSGSNTIEPEGVVLPTPRPSEPSSPSEIPSLQSTIRPSESSSPSDVPSLRPTLRPSQSLAPSTSLRPTTSLRPSQTSSLRPSSIPTLAPPVYCGEIDILTDPYPEDTSWTLSNAVVVNGVSYPNELVLEGSPKEAGRHTYEACLERGDYEFAIFDSFGDGIGSPGYYSVMFDGMVIAQGGEFESEERVSFSLPPSSPQPSESESRPPSETPSSSLQPSESYSPSKTPSSSLQPSPLPSSPPSTYWSTLNWSRQGRGFNGDASHELFGWAVAFSADASTMAIGAPGPFASDDRPGDVKVKVPGYVKVYGREREGSSWEQRGDTIHGEANGDYFGSSLSLSEDGTTLSIGAPGHDSIGADSGQVKVYEWDEDNLDYVQIGDTLYGASSGDEFGRSLDITSGRILAVGADLSDANGIGSRQVTIYAWDEVSSNFQQRGKVINGDASSDRFGYSVSLAEYGQKLAVGAPNNDSNGSNSGQVRVFEWDKATSNYEQLGGSLVGDAAGDRFGRSVSFSRDGTTLAIGAPRNSKNGWQAGQVKVFAWDEAALNFVQIGKSLYGKAGFDRFGSSVVLSSAGKTLAVGAAQNNGPGYAEVYGWDEAASEYKRHGQSLGGEGSGDDFGNALALAGNGRYLAIGAPRNDRNGTDTGRVEVFNIEL